jgi:PKD repeat protein
MSAIPVYFTDTSTPGPSGPIVAWHWDFGDGSTSSGQNPVHTYAGPGSYDVALTITGSGSDGTSTIHHTVVLSAPPINAVFAVNVNNLVVTCTDESTPGPSGPIVGWAWDFGDGGTSTLQNPTHTYASPGTYTITLTVTGTSPDGTDNATHPVDVSSGGTNWSPIVSVDFSTKADGYWPGWCRYQSFDQVYKQGYYAQQNAYVQGGLLHLFSAYGSGPFGNAWYTGAVSIHGGTCGSNPPWPFSTQDSRITLRMRLVSVGTRANGHRNVLNWPDNGIYTSGGEEDMWESDVAYNNASTFLHYGSPSNPKQIAHTHPTGDVDWANWHTYRFQRVGNVVKIYVDDMSTPIYTYTGDSTTLPGGPHHWVIQQQMHTPGGTPAPNGDSEDWQISSVVIEKAT